MNIESVHLSHLPPFSILRVQTVNSVYRVVTTPGQEIYIHGGAEFPDPTAAYLDGARGQESCLCVGWIGVGLKMELRSGDRRIITSPIRAITTEPPVDLVKR